MIKHFLTRRLVDVACKNLDAPPLVILTLTPPGQMRLVSCQVDGIYDILACTKDEFVARVEGGNTTKSMSFDTNDVNQADWPQTVEQAVGRILAEMPEAWKERVRSMPRADLVVFHFGWGTDIRKVFGLWGGNTALMRSCAEESGYSYLDADWASMVIIEAVWQRLRTLER